jgi:hypothetical protein
VTRTKRKGYHQVSLEVVEHDPKTLRLRTVLAEGEVDGEKFEVSLCCSSGWLYVMGREFQYSVSLEDLARSCVGLLGKEGVRR